jgi:nucleotide-binding universal stress UspA family protein
LDAGLDVGGDVSEYKVLIPLDGSRPAEHALAFLPALANLGQLDVTLVSVVDFPEDLLKSVVTEEEERERNLLATYLREIAGDLEKHLSATVHCKIMRGTASTLILEQVKALSPDLLAISTHGRSGIARWQRGAVADKVIRGATCPALVVGPRAMEKGQWLEAGAVPPFTQILVPLDGSEAAEQALGTASGFAEVYASRLHLLRVMPYVPLSSGFWDPPATLMDDILEGGREYLAGVSERVGKAGEVATSVTIGSPAHEIDRYVREQDIDLVVMTSHGRGGLARAALGSVTDRVIGAGPPVLLVRVNGQLA